MLLNVKKKCCLHTAGQHHQQKQGDDDDINGHKSFVNHCKIATNQRPLSLRHDNIHTLWDIYSLRRLKGNKMSDFFRVFLISKEFSFSSVLL